MRYVCIQHDAPNCVMIEVLTVAVNPGGVKLGMGG